MSKQTVERKKKFFLTDIIIFRKVKFTIAFIGVLEPFDDLLLSSDKKFTQNCELSPF